MKRALVVTFDRLHLGYLGCYGNEWIETPNFDRLALESVVFDRHYGENFDMQAANHAWWTGVYQHRLDGDTQYDLGCFTERLTRAGIRSQLWIECDGRIDSSVAPRFDDVQTVWGMDGLDASDPESPFARLVSKCVDVLTKEGESATELVWLKSRGVPVPWLPPRELADLYLDEFGLADEATGGDGNDDVEQDEELAGDEPPMGKGGEPAAAPARTRTPPLPEDVLYARAMYAAYVTHLDRWLGKLWRFVNDSLEWRDALVIVTAAGGENLAEHGTLGEESRRLRDEVTHAPLFLRLPGSPESGSRRPALVQTVDLAPTLCEWFGAADVAGSSSESLCGRSLLPVVRGETDLLRDAAWLGDARGERGIRTDEFLLVTSAGSDAGQSTMESGADALLFEKPYDRWDMSDVRGQYSREADELQERLAK